MTSIARPLSGAASSSVVAVTVQAALPPSATLAAATERTTRPFRSTTPIATFRQPADVCVQGPVARRDPVVAHVAGAEARVDVFELAVVHRVVVVGQLGPGRVAVDRDLDPVARDRLPAIVRRRIPGHHDPVVAAGLRPEIARRARGDGGNVRGVGHRDHLPRPEREGRRVVAVPVLDGGRVVARGRVGVDDRDGLVLPDGGSKRGQDHPFRRGNDMRLADRDPLAIAGGHLEGGGRGQQCRCRPCHRSR